MILRKNAPLAGVAFRVQNDPGTLSLFLLLSPPYVLLAWGQGWTRFHTPEHGAAYLASRFAALTRQT
jgi:hypothetical protein